MRRFASTKKLATRWDHSPLSSWTVDLSRKDSSSLRGLALLQLQECSGLSASNGQMGNTLIPRRSGKLCMDPKAGTGKPTQLMLHDRHCPGVTLARGRGWFVTWGVCQKGRAFLLSLQRHDLNTPKFFTQDMMADPVTLLSGWAECHRQLDVADFMTCMCQGFEINLLQGQWQGRRVLDRVTGYRRAAKFSTNSILLLRLPHAPPGIPPSLQVQSLIDFWSGASVPPPILPLPSA